MEKNKNEIIRIGKLLWDEELVAATCGNISLKADKNDILITSHNSCLGMLCQDDIILMDLSGNTQDKKEPTAEKPLHLAIHKKFSQAAIIHVHPPLTNGYFAMRSQLECLTFESRLLLGDVPCLKQNTPSVTDLDSVIKALENSNIVVLKNHGVIAIGEDLEEVFFLIQLLEESVKSSVVAQLFQERTEKTQEGTGTQENIPKFEMFSDEHIKTIVDLINKDDGFLAQAKSFQLKTKLAVKMDETGKVFCFNFQDGMITDVSHSDKEAEFVISGPQLVWRKIFNRELDPFVATTQKKLKLKGDFGKISRWYAPFNKMFEVWQKVGVK